MCVCVWLWVVLLVFVCVCKMESYMPCSNQRGLWRVRVCVYVGEAGERLAVIAMVVRACAATGRRWPLGRTGRRSC
jgi:hypothetical protein